MGAGRPARCFDITSGNIQNDEFSLECCFQMVCRFGVIPITLYSAAGCHVSGPYCSFTDYVPLLCG